ncbi:MULTISPECIES: hypothetical protein [unclassified Streptomyces]|uniref:hypothetical protein n=1 Tax=unclassified Streptomyces TaxID=2593676 RepID=UPI0004BDE245|nr:MULTISPECIES: hypothetical protein [unclassified Streptomyces]
MQFHFVGRCGIDDRTRDDRVAAFEGARLAGVRGEQVRTLADGPRHEPHGVLDGYQHDTAGVTDDLGDGDACGLFRCPEQETGASDTWTTSPGRAGRFAFGVPPSHLPGWGRTSMSSSPA